MENVHPIKLVGTKFLRRISVIDGADNDYKSIYKEELERLKELVRACESLSNEFKGQVLNKCRIGNHLRYIRDERLFEYDDDEKITSVDTFAKKWFGISKSACYQLIRVADKFYIEDLDVVGYSVAQKSTSADVCTEYRDMSGYSFYKLFELIDLDYRLISRYVVDETKTVSELKTLVSNLIASEIALKAEEEREAEVRADEEKNRIMSYNPRQAYERNYFEQLTKTELIRVIIELQTTYLSTSKKSKK